jgi:hypothetical protein
VEALAKEFQKKFNRFNLVAASKLLWLSCRDPFIICDKRAVRALKRNLRHNFRAQSYPEYCCAWREEYSKREVAIGTAISRLAAVGQFIPEWKELGDDLPSLSNEPWFRERVFDHYLWGLGVAPD